MGRSQVENTTVRFTQEFLALDRDRKPITRLVRSRPPQFLSIDAGELSDLSGIDVAFPWRRMDQRQPIGFAHNFPERDISDAFTSEFEGNAGSSMMFLMEAVLPSGEREGTINLDLANSILRLGIDQYKNVFSATGWPSYLANGNGFVEWYNVTEGEVERMEIVGIDSFTQPNDSLRLLPAPTGNGNHRDVVRVVSFRNFDRRGIFMSNGRRVFQFRSSHSTELLRIKEGSMGDRVRGARISNNRFLFVSPQFPPRLVTLPNESNNMPILSFDGASYDNATLKITKTGRFALYDRVKGDVAVVVSGSQVAAGTYRIVASDDDTLELASSAGAGGAATDVLGHVLRRISEEDRFAGPVPPFGLGRNTLGPGKAITLTGVQGGGDLTKGLAAVRVRLFDLDTNSASGFYQAGDVTAGRDPESDFEKEIKEENMALTVHFQRRSNKDQFVALDRRSHVVQIFRRLSGGSTYHMEVEIPVESLIDLASTVNTSNITLTLSDEDLSRKAQLSTADSIKGVPPACKDIAILGSTGTVLLAGKADVENFKHPTIEGIPFKWPLIDNDNVIHVSRIDINEPENFPPRITNQIEISILGDKFQRFSTAGNTVVAVMSRGVYFFQAGGQFGITRNVVAESGLGTPWPESVISVERHAFWVTPNNCYLFNPEEPDIEDQLIPIGGTITEWLRDAFDLGEEIQSSYDQRRRVIVVRRITDRNTIQDWEYHITTGNSTFVDDRTALVYVSATSANVAATSKDRAVLYSVDHSGQVFEIGRRIRVGDTLNYDTGTIQDTLDGTYTINDESISNAVNFPTSTLGDSIRFRSPNPAVDGQVRKLSSLFNLGTTLTLDVNAAHANRIGFAFLRRHIALVAWEGSSRAGEVRFQPVQFDSGSPVVSKGSLFLSEQADTGSLDSGVSIVSIGFNESWSLQTRPNGGAVVVRRVFVHEDDTVANSHADAETVAVGIEVDSTLGSRKTGGIVAIGVRKTVAMWDSSGASRRVKAICVVRDKEEVFNSGSLLNLTAADDSDAHDVLAIGDDKALVIYHDNTANDIRAQVLSVTGLTITPETALSVSSVDFGDYASALGRSSDNGSVVLYRTATGVEAAFLNHASTTVTKTGVIAVSANEALRIYKVLMVSSTKGVFCWHDSTDNKVKLQGFRIAGSAIVLSTAGATNLLGVGNSTTHAVNMAVVNLNNFVVLYRDPADSDNIKIVDGLIYNSNDNVTVSSFGFLFATNGLVFDAVPGLAEGDEFMIGTVPFRMKFAPIVGDRTRNGKRLDGVSVWAKPAGRTVTTTKKLQLHIYRNFDSAREKLNYNDDTELEIAIKAPSEVSAVDEDLFVSLTAVEGKAIELELENLDTDTGIELVNVAGIVKETGDLTEDRDTAT